ncbi:MAG: hypothetical protein WBB65_02825 [Anaerolineales bacterium]
MRLGEKWVPNHCRQVQKTTAIVSQAARLRLAIRPLAFQALLLLQIVLFLFLLYFHKLEITRSDRRK